MFSIVVALGFKGYTAFSLMREESLGHKNAVLAEGQITRIRRKVRAGALIYVYQGRFQDRNGVGHDFFHYANERQQEGWLQPLSQRTRQALKDRQAPAPIVIAYDPRWPARNWVEGIHDEQWRLYKFLGYVVILQSVFTFCFAVGLAAEIRNRQEIPWWHDLHMVLPLVVASVCFGFAGLMVGVLNPLLDLVFGS